uniref:Apple domain-containing protein n=1 Tax=Plectus sambesii TaxID=2011161 RepID=A0A914VAH3_9BILA
MASCRNRSYFINLRVILLLLIHNCRLHAAVLTYDGCMSDSANSYKVGGWCFLVYSNSSMTTKTLTQAGAQTVCGPMGNLAVGVTYKMLEKYKTQYLSASVKMAWLPLVRNASSGWAWKTLMPRGNYAVFPAIMANIPSAANEMNDGGVENAAVAYYSMGISDLENDLSIYASTPIAVICQFAPLLWKYLQRGHGLFKVPAYLIAQANVTRAGCFRQCHRSPFCISMAFNPTTNDCQTYGVSPEDPRFSGNVTANSAYDWHIRDGMEY